MAEEKRLDADKVRHIIERHIADVIYRGIGHIPSGKDSNSAYEFLRGYEEGAKYIANLILREDNLVDAVEVVRGRWEDGICTMCGYPIPTDSKCDFIDEDDCLFCYHCGAKMKGENEDG